MIGSGNLRRMGVAVFLSGLAFASAGCAGRGDATAVKGVTTTRPNPGGVSQPGSSTAPEVRDFPSVAPTLKPDASVGEKPLQDASLLGDWTARITFKKIVGPNAPPAPSKPLVRTFRFVCADGGSDEGCTVELIRETSQGFSTSRPVTLKNGIIRSQITMPSYRSCEGTKLTPKLSVELKVTKAKVRDGAWVATAIKGTGVELHRSQNESACPGFRADQSIKLVRA